MNKIIVFLFLLSVFFISFLPVKDTDFGWHYRCGKEFWSDKSICLKNNFSYFLANYQSAYPGLLYDIPLAFIYDRFGFVGISLVGATVMTLSAFIFLQLSPAALWLKIPSFYLILFLSFPVFSLGLRSQTITYLFFLVILFILQKAKEKQKYLLFLPLLFLVWVNVHIGFFIGLILLLFYGIENGFKPFSILIFLLSFLITLINPFGINIYKEIFNHTTAPMNQMIAEWVAPPLWQNVLVILSTLTAGVLMIKNKSISLFHILLLIFFAFLSLKARRNLPFFYTSFFLMAHFRNDRVQDALINQAFIPILLSLTTFFAIINIPSILGFHQSWDIYCNQGLSRYPCEAIKNYPQLSGNVFNTYEWGGFLIWQKPNIKVFVDGRMPAWEDKEGKSPYQVFLEIIQTQPGWNERLRKWKTDYLLISPGTFLDLLLQKEAVKYGWSEKYRDEVAVIYKKL